MAEDLTTYKIADYNSLLPEEKARVKIDKSLKKLNLEE